MVNVDGVEYMTSDDAAAYVGVTRGTWNTYVNRGRAPAASLKLGRLVLYKREDVVAWHKSRPGRGNWGGR